MPWRKADALSERTKFILEWERRCAQELGPPNVSELCRMYGISRQTGHLWISRYVQGGCDLRTLDDRSRRPHSNPRAVTPEIEDFVVAARKSETSQLLSPTLVSRRRSPGRFKSVKRRVA